MIDIQSRGDVVIVRLEHGKANAMDLELCERLRGAFAELSDTAGAVVLTGRGGIFSAGVDLLRVLEEGPPYIDGFVAALSGMCEAIFQFPRPLVAAVNGHAIAGGCVLACMADRRIMAEGSGRIGVPELLVGVPFPAAPLEVMRSVVPPHRFAEVIIGGATYEPSDAVGLGLVDETAPPDDLLDRSCESAGRMAALAPRAFRLTKRQIRAPVVERIRVGNAAHDDAIREAWMHPETLAAIRDYVQRTFKRSSS